MLGADLQLLSEGCGCDGGVFIFKRCKDSSLGLRLLGGCVPQLHQGVCLIVDMFPWCQWAQSKQKHTHSLGRKVMPTFQVLSKADVGHPMTKTRYWNVIGPKIGCTDWTTPGVSAWWCPVSFQRSALWSERIASGKTRWPWKMTSSRYVRWVTYPTTAMDF